MTLEQFQSLKYGNVISLGDPLNPNGQIYMVQTVVRDADGNTTHIGVIPAFDSELAGQMNLVNDRRVELDIENIHAQRIGFLKDTSLAVGQPTVKKPGAEWPLSKLELLPAPAMRKLGKLPKVHDSRPLRLANYIDKDAFPKVPSGVNWGYADKTGPIGPMLNTQLGCCGISGGGHYFQQVNGNAGHKWIPPDSLILSEYEALGGYKPGDPSTDNGTVLLYNLRRWNSIGFGGHKLGGYAEINTADPLELQLAVWLLGGAYLGVQLPLAVQSASSWAVTGEGPYWDAGSWGGHCVLATSLESTGFYVNSWGEYIMVDWNFYAKYFDEAWALFSQDWLETSGNAPSGFNKVALVDDLFRLKSA